MKMLKLTLSNENKILINPLHVLGASSDNEGGAFVAITDGNDSWHIKESTDEFAIMWEKAMKG